jgi:hypothetical protein
MRRRISSLSSPTFTGTAGSCPDRFSESWSPPPAAPSGRSSPSGSLDTGLSVEKHESRGSGRSATGTASRADNERVSDSATGVAQPKTHSAGHHTATRQRRTDQGCGSAPSRDDQEPSAKELRDCLRQLRRPMHKSTMGLLPKPVTAARPSGQPAGAPRNRKASWCHGIVRQTLERGGRRLWRPRAAAGPRRSALSPPTRRDWETTLCT